MKRSIVILSILVFGIMLFGASCNKTTTQTKGPVTDNHKLTNNEVQPSAVSIDTDGDGLTDEQERTLGTDLTKADTDGDGYGDGVEINNSYDPLKPPVVQNNTTSNVTDTCLGEKDEYDRNMCYLDLVEKTKDMKWCDLISDLERREDCYGGSIFLKEQITLTDLNTCDKISDEDKKSGCYITVARVAKQASSSLCNVFKNRSVKDNCVQRMDEFQINPYILADRDTVGDIKGIQTALEIYYMDTNHYPVVQGIQSISGKCLSSNGFENSCTGKTIYIQEVSTSNTPIGNCLKQDYTYSSVNGGSDYKIEFCLGGPTDGLSSGIHTATSAGFK